MANSPIAEGTWTLHIRNQRDGVWSAWLRRSSIIDPRFQRARFTLAGGEVILISADQLRAALRDWLADPLGDIRPVKIDVKRSTVNGIPVEIEHAA